MVKIININIREMPKAQRLRLANLVKNIAKSHGKGFKVQPVEKVIIKLVHEYPSLEGVIYNALESQNNLSKLLIALTQHMHPDKISNAFLHNLLLTVINSIKAASTVVKYIVNAIKFLIKKLNKTILKTKYFISSIAAAIIVSFVYIGLSLFLHRYVKNINNVPDAVTPSVNVSVVKLPNLNENALLVPAGAILFILFLKAAFAHNLLEEIKEKIEVMKGAAIPTGVLLSMLISVLTIGTSAATALAV